MSRGSRSREADYGRDERRPRIGGSSSIESRVYIGNLNVKNFSYREISDWMDKYGKVIDVNFCDRFILVQFDRESDARRAVDREKGQSFRGSRFDIRMAHSSDGSTSNSSRSELPRSRSPRALPYERATREISPGYRDSGRDRSPIDRERYYKERRGNSPEQRVYERPRMIEEERPRSNIHPEYPVVEYQEPNWNAPPLTNKVTAERPGFDAAIIVMSSDLLGYAETIEAKLQRQIALTTHIIVLKEESHANACIEDLNNKAVLYAFLVNHMNQKHLSCTLRILYGSGQEHRNMLLNNALSFVARNFEDYQKRVRELKSIAPKPNYDPSRMPPGFLAPDDKTIYQLHLLADSRMLTIDELNEVDQFIQKRIQILAQAEGILEKPSNTLSMLSNDAMQNNPAKIIAAGNPNIRDEKALIAQQNQLHSKILNILKPPALTTNNTVPGNKDVNNSPADQFSSYNESTLSSTTGSNPLTNPKVQQALDSLMQSKFRPNLPEQHAEDNSVSVRGFQSSNIATSSQVTPNQPPSNQYVNNMNPTNMSTMNPIANNMNAMNPNANNMNTMNTNQMNLINTNMNRPPNPMANAAMRGIAPTHNYQPNYQGYFQQPPVGQPMYRPRQPFQPRPQYPGY